MMEIALSLLACAVFAALTAVGVTAALRSARVDDLIGDVFSPWIRDPFAAPEAPAAPMAPETSGIETRASKEKGIPAEPTDGRPAAARA